MNEEALIVAENAVIGCMLADNATIPEVLAKTGADDYSGRNVAVVEAVAGLSVAGTVVDPLTVWGELVRRGRGHSVGSSATLFELQSFGIPQTLNYHLDEVVKAKRLRQFQIFATRFAEATNHPEADPANLAARLVRAGEQASDTVGDTADIHVPTLREFLDTPDPEYDWVIPDMLERGDRLILTGAEGLGKSTLFRQLAVCVAAGVHPFSNRTIQQKRTLIVDCENGPVTMRRKLRPLAIQARQQGYGADDTLFVEGRPEGLNLLDPRDQQWLIQRVQRIQPAVLFTGSLYKLFEEDPNKEQPARTVAAVLDRCRVAGNCAVVLEAHSPHAQGSANDRAVRPIGASMWLRWPEFGYGLRPAEGSSRDERIVDFVPWRGDRDERAWPRQLRSGSIWPWEEPY